MSTSTYASPRRVAMGVDSHRLALIMAVLEKHASCQLQGLDVFVNVVGGLTSGEPPIDLGLALAKECRTLGFTKVICPTNLTHAPNGLQVAKVNTLVEALEQAL